MRRLLLLAALLVSVLAPIAADAAGFTERFTTDPFRFPRRWCARAHGATWDSAGFLNVWKDTNTAARVTSTGCHAYVPTPVGEDAGSTFGRYLIRTALPFAGAARRTIRVRFGLPANFTSTDTLEVYAAVHPHCNAGIKGILYSPLGDGQYRLKVDIADSADGSAATECGYLGGSSITSTPSDLFELPADAINKDRYEILLRVIQLATGRLESTLKVYDLQVSDTVAVENAPKDRFLAPVWWGRHAQFFGIGGDKSVSAKTPIGKIILDAQ